MTSLFPCVAYTIQDAAKEFMIGERRTTTRTERSRRPVPSCTDENAETIDKIVEADPHVSCNHLEGITILPQSSVHRILTGKHDPAAGGLR